MYATDDGNFFYEEAKNYADSHARSRKIELFTITRADLPKKKTEKKEEVETEVKSEEQEETKEEQTGEVNDIEEENPKKNKSKK